MSTKLQSDPRQYDPYRTTDWRWRYATEHLITGDRVRRWEDPEIKETVRFLRALLRVKEGKRHGVQRRWPELSAAHALFLRADLQRDELEARLLTFEPMETIAQKMGLEAAVVATYERMFFNISHAQKAISWLVLNATGLGSDNAITEGMIWRYSAIAGGPLILQLLMADYLGRPQPDMPDRHELAETARFMVREFAGGWSSAVSRRETVKQYCRMFKARTRQIDSDERKKLKNQLRFLRLAAEQSPRLTCRDAQDRAPETSSETEVNLRQGVRS